MIKHRHVVHQSKEKKIKQYGVSSQMFMIQATKKDIFNRKKCPTFLRSKDLKQVSDNTCYAGAVPRPFMFFGE